jgi:hypothetical protein
MDLEHLTMTNLPTGESCDMLEIRGNSELSDDGFYVETDYGILFYCSDKYLYSYKSV